MRIIIIDFVLLSYLPFSVAGLWGQLSDSQHWRFVALRNKAAKRHFLSLSNLSFLPEHFCLGRERCLVLLVYINTLGVVDSFK